MSRLTIVSANLRRDGGGAAALGRRVVVDARAFAEEHGLGLRVLHLDSPDADLGAEVRHFHGRRAALALAVARAQRGSGAVLFDHLGPARVQAWLPAAWRRPYGLFLLGVELAAPLRGDRRRAVERAALRLAISEHTRRLARQAAGAEAAVLHPALEERPPAGEPDAGLLARVGEGFFLIVGRLSSRERYKGHQTLFEALAGLPARLVVVGEGDDREWLEACARPLGERVTFTGFVSEATRDALYARCRALVMPSRGEGFGLVYLEAMRAGKPSIALRESAADEIVVDGETGALVGPGPESLRAALVRLGSEEVARRLGDAACRRYESHFAPARFRAAFFVHLDALLRGAAARRAA